MTGNDSPRTRPAAVPTAHPVTVVLASRWDQPTRSTRPYRQGGHVRRALDRVVLRALREARPSRRTARDLVLRPRPR